MSLSLSRQKNSHFVGARVCAFVYYFEDSGRSQGRMRLLTHTHTHTYTLQTRTFHSLPPHTGTVTLAHMLSSRVATREDETRRNENKKHVHFVSTTFNLAAASDNKYRHRTNCDNENHLYIPCMYGGDGTKKE